MTEEQAQKLMEITAQSYSVIAPQFSQTRSKSWADCSVLTRLVNEGDRVLDLGCGNGRLLQSLAGKRISYIGVDGSDQFVQIARERYEADGHAFAIGNMLSLDAVSEIAGQMFDAICCIAAVHHLPTRGLRLAALRQMRSRLAPGGRLLMTNWNKFRLSFGKKEFWAISLKKIMTSNELWIQQVGLPKSAFGWCDLPVHWRRESRDQVLYYYAFTATEIDALMFEAGFSRVESWYSKDGQRVHWWSGDNILTVGYA